MKLILWLLVLFTAAVGVTLAIKDNPGHAILVMEPYINIKLSLGELIISAIAAFVVFYVLVQLMLGLLGFGQWYRHRKTDERMLSGLRAYFEGNYVQARKSAASVLRLAESPAMKAIGAVIAARAAHKLDESTARDEYLTMADHAAPNEKLLRLITRAELLLDDGRHEEALSTLQALYASGGLQQTAVLQLELEAQRRAGNWDAVVDLADLLAKRQYVDKALIQKVRHDAHLENIKSKSSDLQSLNHYWLNIPPLEKRDSKLVVAAARAYIALGDCASAHQIIEQFVSKEWNAELILLYADCLGFHVNRQIECAEVWLKSYPNNAQLLLTLGKLCTYCELWGKAQNYLEASLSIESSDTAHFALAQLNEKLGKHELAMSYYNKGLESTLKQLN